jgi:hypothetical protein
MLVGGRAGHIVARATSFSLSRAGITAMTGGKTVRTGEISSWPS